MLYIEVYVGYPVSCLYSILVVTLVFWCREQGVCGSFRLCDSLSRFIASDFVPVGFNGVSCCLVLLWEVVVVLCNLVTREVRYCIIFSVSACSSEFFRIVSHSFLFCSCCNSYIFFISFSMYVLN